MYDLLAIHVIKKSGKNQTKKKSEEKKLIYNVNETHQFQICANINLFAGAVTLPACLYPQVAINFITI